MTHVARAVWFIESHFADDVSLADVAAALGVSRYHLVRAFGLATGWSVMRYMRARRLTEAARALANGAPDILAVALDAGYGSHEAFTRSFRDQFGLTPEAVRAGGDLSTLSLVEAITMDNTTTFALTEPRIETGKAMSIAGLAARFAFENLGAIPTLWQRFAPHIGNVPGQVGRVAYGVCSDTDDTGFNYIAGVEVTDNAHQSPDFTTLRLPERQYAVFTHGGHVSAVRATMMAIFNDWLPRSKYQAAEAPVFERYDQRFDPRTGNGGFEIWVPIFAR